MLETGSVAAAGSDLFWRLDSNAGASRLFAARSGGCKWSSRLKTGDSHYSSPKTLRRKKPSRPRDRRKRQVRRAKETDGDGRSCDANRWSQKGECGGNRGGWVGTAIERQPGTMRHLHRWVRRRSAMRSAGSGGRRRYPQTAFRGCPIQLSIWKHHPGALDPSVAAQPSPSRSPPAEEDRLRGMRKRS